MRTHFMLVGVVALTVGCSGAMGQNLVTLSLARGEFAVNFAGGSNVDGYGQAGTSNTPGGRSSGFGNFSPSRFPGGQELDSSARYQYLAELDPSRLSMSGKIASHSKSVNGPSSYYVSSATTSKSAIYFSAPDPVGFHLSGFVSVTGASAIGNGYAAVNAWLRLDQNYLFEQYGVPVNQFVPFDIYGTLPRGSHVLQCQASASTYAAESGGLFSVTTEYSAVIEFFPVPAPAGAGVVAVGTWTALRRRRPA